MSLSFYLQDFDVIKCRNFLKEHNTAKSLKVMV